jgi:hypothetical protein
MKSGPPHFQEKRQSPRQILDLQVAITVEGGSGPVPGQCRDMSIGGVFVVTEAKAPFGGKVKLQIDFPAPTGTVVIDAVVRWTAPDGLGLQFGALGAMETHAIVNLLSPRKP